MVQGNICMHCDHQVAILECPQCLQKHYCSILCQRAHARQIGQLCPSQRRSGNINISDRNQPHDGRSSELVVPIVVDNTISPHSRSVTLPNIVHTVTRSMERTVDQYISSQLPVLQGPSHEADQQLNSGTCFHRVTDVRYGTLACISKQWCLLATEELTKQ